MDKAVTRITRTALFTALLVALQAATLPFGNTLVTGSVVNLLLILAALFLDLPAAAAVGLLSPAVAKFLGIGPLWALIPFIALGNLVTLSGEQSFTGGGRAGAHWAGPPSSPHPPRPPPSIWVSCSSPSPSS